MVGPDLADGRQHLPGEASALGGRVGVEAEVAGGMSERATSRRRAGRRTWCCLSGWCGAPWRRASGRLGHVGQGEAGQARLLSTASVSSATSTAPALVRTVRFTAPSSPTRSCGRRRTRSASSPGAMATTSTWTSLAWTRLLEGLHLADGDLLAGRPPGGGGLGGGHGRLPRTVDAAACRPTAAALAAPDASTESPAGRNMAAARPGGSAESYSSRRRRQRRRPGRQRPAPGGRSGRGQAHRPGQQPGGGAGALAPGARTTAGRDERKTIDSAFMDQLLGRSRRGPGGRGSGQARAPAPAGQPAPIRKAATAGQVDPASSRPTYSSRREPLGRPHDHERQQRRPGEHGHRAEQWGQPEADEGAAVPAAGTATAARTPGQTEHEQQRLGAGGDHRQHAETDRERQHVPQRRGGDERPLGPAVPNGPVVDRRDVLAQRLEHVRLLPGGARRARSCRSASGTGGGPRTTASTGSAAALGRLAVGLAPHGPVGATP